MTSGQKRACCCTDRQTDTWGHSRTGLYPDVAFVSSEQTSDDVPRAPKWSLCDVACSKKEPHPFKALVKPTSLVWWTQKMRIRKFCLRFIRIVKKNSSNVQKSVRMKTFRSELQERSTFWKHIQTLEAQRYTLQHFWALPLFLTERSELRVPFRSDAKDHP